MKDPIVIVSAGRIPIGNFGGYYKNMPATVLGKLVIQGVLDRIKLAPELIEEVLMGCVLPAGLGQAPARQAAITAGIPITVPCTTINKVCGSSMKAIAIAHDEILADSFQTILAGGMENMSRAPYLLPTARFGSRIGKAEILDHMMHDGLEDAYQTGKSMGCFAEECVQQFKFTRQQQDEFALASLSRAKAATQKGYFANEIIPVEIHTDRGELIQVDQDEGPLKVDPEKIAKLKPVFQKDGTITAANSSSISDGAAAVILMKESKAKKLGLTPFAKIVGHSTFAHDPSWFTTAPIGAIASLIKKINWTIDEVDLFEINEAFAAVTMVTMQELKIPHEKVNVNGGACVLGHPLGATGARLIVTLSHAMHNRKLNKGIASLCIGGGEAMAIGLELI